MFAIAFVLLLSAILVLWFIFGRTMSQFNQRWPPISDDEFVARCTPGTSRDTALRVRRIVSEQLGVPYDQIYPEQEFVRDLYAD